MLERIDIFNVSNLYSWLQYDSHTTPRPSLFESHAIRLGRMERRCGGNVRWIFAGASQTGHCRCGCSTTPHVCQARSQCILMARTAQHGPKSGR